jgi:perosamine synthetase
VKEPDYLPYGRQSIDDDDIEAVVAALRSDWLTTGPRVPRFEEAVASACGAGGAVAVSSGTAALHAAMRAIGIGPGDEVIVPAMTFAATANAVVYCGGRPVFADVEPDTLLLSRESVERLIGPRTRAVVAVDYAGQPCDYDALRTLTEPRGLKLVADACHSLGAYDRGRRVGSIADVSALSFHPVKHITTGEGGAVVSNDENVIASARIFRNHGITTDHRQREKQGSWFYEMTALGYNYRITDIQCALGISQLTKLERWVDRRREIAARYDDALRGLPDVRPLQTRPEARHAYHLYVVSIGDSVAGGRDGVFSALRAVGIGVNVHYIPVHLHPFYRREFGTSRGTCPVAEAAYERIVSLPMFPAMRDSDVDRVVEALCRATAGS